MYRQKSFERSGDDGNINLLAKKVSQLSAHVNDLEGSIQASLKTIRKENDQQFFELKTMVSSDLLKGKYHEGDKNAPEKRSTPTKEKNSYGRNYDNVTNVLPYNSWVETPSEKNEAEPYDRMVATSNQVYTEIHVAHRMAGLKHERPLSKALKVQYDDALERHYLNQWPDAVPQYKNNHQCCCRRDPERDTDAREILRQVFPPYLFFLIVLSGAIPPRSKCLFGVITAIWVFYCVHIVYTMVVTSLMIAVRSLCLLEPNCMPMDPTFSFSGLIGMLFGDLSNMLSIVLIHTHLRDLLQSRELLTLISSIDPGRTRKPESGWRCLFLLYSSITSCLIGFATYRSVADPSFVPAAMRAVAYFFYMPAPLTNLLFFYVVSHAICLSYDDWTSKMVAATSKSLLLCSKSQSRSVEVNLLHNLQARVALSALITRNARVLLLPSLLAVVALYFYFLRMLTTTNASSVGDLIEIFFSVSLRQALPLVFALYVSSRTDILENIVAQASLRKVTEYLARAPKEWMLGQKLSLNTDLLAKASSALVLVFSFSTLFVALFKQATTTPWDSRYEHFGTCADGVRSGLEQHIDCGPPESSCRQTCREKYGEYILIPENRDCTEVDGYTHITTQRACTAAYKTWAQSENKTHSVSNSDVYEGFLDIHNFRADWKHANWTNWTDGFRCGAYIAPINRLGFETSMSVSFPALFPSRNTDGQYQKPLAYMCYAGPRSCKAKAHDRAHTHFEEMMACPGPGQHALFASAWRNISGPLPGSNWGSSGHVAEFHAGRGDNGDCARIQVHNAAGVGAQVVFTLACNVSTHGEPDVVCPKDNLVRLDVKSGPTLRGVLTVSPTANMSSMSSIAAYHLEPKSRNIIVESDSTLMLVADQSSDPMTVTLCV